MKAKLYITVLMLLCTFLAHSAEPIIIDHTCIDIYQVPVEYINAAKANLHISYGYTSHGRQIIKGMDFLDGFMNTKPGYPQGLFAHDPYNVAGKLHFDIEGNLSDDAGYYPDWVNETRDFLGTPDSNGRGSSRPEFNVIIWAWCSQLSWYSTEDVYNMYLNDMNQLEEDYFGVTFIYMTGHSDGSGLEGDLHRNNTTIRNYCVANNKVLFDFYDIECYDPDGNYYGDKHVTDGCYYDGGGNWAQDWQNSHIEGVDWYLCNIEYEHTEPIVCNMKAWAIWWLWARLAGWEGPEGTRAADNNPVTVTSFALQQNYPNPFNASTTIEFTLTEKTEVTLAIYNINGQIVQTALDEIRNAGKYSVQVTMTDNPTGIYYYTLQAGRQRLTRKLLFLK